jgi:hypothetical protein
LAEHLLHSGHVGVHLAKEQRQQGNTTRRSVIPNSVRGVTGSSLMPTKRRTPMWCMASRMFATPAECNLVGRRPWVPIRRERVDSVQDAV